MAITIKDISPKNNAIDVNANVSIKIIMSSLLKLSSISEDNILLRDEHIGIITPSTVSYSVSDDGTNGILTLLPSIKLNGLTKYMIVIRGIIGVNDEPLSSLELHSVFTTGELTTDTIITSDKIIFIEESCALRDGSMLKDEFDYNKNCVITNEIFPKGI